jgi:hypothetical protein
MSAELFMESPFTAHRVVGARLGRRRQQDAVLAYLRLMRDIAGLKYDYPSCFEYQRAVRVMERLQEGI